MASMLRSGKFVRFFSNVTRNFDLSNGGRSNADSQLCTRKKEWEIKIYRSLSTVQLPRKTLNDESNVIPAASTEQTSVDRALARAELDVKKLGRVTRDDIESIAEEIKTLRFATTTQSLLLIRCCGGLVPEEPPSARTKLAKDIWKMLESFGVPLDISHYNALLRVYLENEHSFNQMKFLSMLEEKTIQPNRVTYQRLLASFCQKGDIDGASQVLEMMKAKDMPIGEFVFNSLVTGHSNAGDMESAKGVIKVMVQAGLEPNNETYKALLCGYARQGLIQDISATLSECEKNEVMVHDRDLLEILYIAAVNNHSSVVDDLLTRMQKLSGYNQDCINVILRLVNCDQEEEAFKVLLSMKPPLLNDGQMPSVGGFFIRQVVKCKCKPEKIVKFCQKLVDSGMNPRAYFRALEAANTFGDKELSQVLLQEITKQKEKLRPQAFWPLLNAQSKAHGEKGVLDVLRQMAAVRVIPNVDTINQHVLPHLAGENARSLVRKLRSADVPSSVVAISLLTQSLDRLDFKSAIEIAKLYTIADSAFIRRAAANAYVKTNDANSLVTLMQTMLRDTVAKGTEAEIKDRAAEIAGPIVQEVYTVAPKPKLEVVEPLLKTLQEYGIGIPQVVSHFIQEKAGENMTESVAELLVALGSGNLTPVELKQIQSEESRNDPTRRAIARFVSLARTHKLEEALKEKENLESAKIPFTDGMNILLMDLYVHHDKLDEALAVFNQLFEHNKDISVNPPKVLNLAARLLKADRTEEALKVLSKLKPGTDESTQAFNATEITAWRLLNVAAVKGDVELTKKVFDSIEDSKIIKISNQLLGPLIQVHLARDDIETALKTFSECAEKYRATPMKSTLATKFIEAEDAQRLQQLMDISIKVHGEMNSLYDLVFAFLSCGRVRQARKVLETPGLRARGQRIEVACQRYAEEKRITELENLVKITKDVFDVDRHMMYDYLLSAYINASDPKKAIGLWTQMQEEDLLPKDDFLRKLGKFLTDSNEPVPFTVPTDAQESAPHPAVAPVVQPVRQRREPAAKGEIKQPVKAAETSKAVPEKVVKLREALTAEDIDAALDAKQQWEAEGGALTVSDHSRLIEVSVRKGRLSDATKLTVDMLTLKKNPYPRVLRYLLGALTAGGDHEAIATIGKHLSQEAQRNVSFENFYSSSMGRSTAAATEYIDSMLKEIKEAANETDQEKKEQNLKALTSRFPRGGLLGILEKNPDLLPKCQELAAAFLKEGMMAPTNTMWCYYMNTGMESEAKSAWEALKQSPVTIMFQPVCRRAKMQGNPVLVESLIEMLSSSPNVKTSALGVAYSAWIDVHCAKNELDAALGTVERALKGGVQLTEINHTALVNLQSALEAAGRTFPHSIPKPSEKS